MICPNCGAQSPTDDCINCGIIISKHIALEAKQHEQEGQPQQKKKIEVYIEEKPGPAKAIILNSIFITVCLLTYIIYSPFRTANNLEKALNQRDSAQLSEYIDYDTLRNSLKQQFDSRIIEGLNKTGGNSLAPLTAAYVSKLTDPMVEEATTPEGLAKIMTGYKQLKNKGKGPEVAELGPNEERAVSGIFLEARRSYESANMFSIVISTEKGNETRIMMKRTGIFSWKLDHIVLGAE